VRTGNFSAMSGGLGGALSITARSNKKQLNGPPEPATFLYLGQPGEGALKSERSVRSRKQTLKLRKATKSKVEDVMITQITPVKKPAFNNNSYAIIKKEIKSSPKMANLINEVYDTGKMHKDLQKKRKNPV